MARISFVNGHYVEASQAVVSIEDRGYQFADGIYEVIYFRNKKFVDGTGHFERLKRSLKELYIPMPMSVTSMKVHAHHLMALNRCEEGLFYIQVTRGVAKRQHHFPKNIYPQIILSIYPCRHQNRPQSVSIVTLPDRRWKRCDIKSISLLPNVMGKQLAKEDNAFEAWLIDENGFITEGTSTNAWIVKDHKLITAPEGQILAGITRARILTLAHDLNIIVEERPFHETELLQASEAFLTSTSGGLVPVIKVNNQTIGLGKIGPLSFKLRLSYETFLELETGPAYGL
jgi:D-alanine transaminase